MKFPRLPLELITFFYFLLYVPYFVLVRWLATTPAIGLGRPLTGLEILPGTQILSGAGTFLFCWLGGWWLSAHHTKIGPFKIAIPTRWTFLSGLCTALVLVTVPLSATFQGVSIPFIQILMRGDVLILAPLVDLVSGRKVRWYSWAALGIVFVALAITLNARGGFHLPPLAIATVVLYTLGYFGRLAVMTHVSKTGEPGDVRRYFVEEKLVGIPAAIALLAAIPFLGLGAQGGELQFGFVGVWTSNQLGWIVLASVLLFVISVISAVILLDKRENTYCVPLERSASILAGTAAAFILAYAFGKRMPTSAEIIGAAMLIGAIVLLSIGPMLGRKAS